MTEFITTWFVAASAVFFSLLALGIIFGVLGVAAVRAYRRVDLWLDRRQEAKERAEAKARPCDQTKDNPLGYCPYERQLRVTELKRVV